MNRLLSINKFVLFQLKAKEEERKRTVGKWSEQKLGPESSNAPKKFQEKNKSAGVIRKNVSIQNSSILFN